MGDAVQEPARPARGDGAAAGATGAGGPALDPSSPLPLYQQIVAVLTSRIAAGEWEVGARMPGEHDLSEEFGVSRITAKRALDELALAGFVTRERGRGTRLLAPTSAPPMQSSIEGWLDQMAHMQRTTGVRLLGFGPAAAPPSVAEMLGVAPGTRLLRTVRVRSLDDAPLSHLTAWLPEHVAGGITAADLEAVPLLKLIERAGVRVNAARQTVSATLAAPDVAQSLALYAGAPLLEVRRVVSDAEGRPVQYLRALYHPDRYQMAMTMTRIEGDGGMQWSPAPALPGHAGGEE
ncbi:MAG: GntR family transcriptional regulator [Paracoccaceae bacterium]|jgi:GntR family transcriptional regulator|nr:GntR family transcriptional regulator [Paracoccaceae bacterium]